MADEFPGYQSHNLLEKDGSVRRYRYRTTAKAFKLEEWLYTLLGVMAEEFPGYETHELVSKSAAIRRYLYSSTATAAKLEEWLIILLRDMNFDVDRHIEIHMEGAEMTVEKLVPTPSRRESADERRRFN